MLHGWQSSRRLSIAARFLAAIACAAICGCASGVYDVTEIPREALVGPTANTKTLDLSRLVAVAPTTDMIDTGDVLEVTMGTGYDSLQNANNAARTFPVRVLDDGLANVPLVGRVALAGLDLEGAEQTIAAAAVERSVFRNPLVTVLMKRQGFNRVTVIGAVKAQGVYELPRRNSSLLSAIVAAGGLSNDASADVRLRLPADDRRRHNRPPSDSVARGNVEADPAGYVDETGSSGTRAVLVSLTSPEAAMNGGRYLADGAYVEVVRRDPRPVSVLGLVGTPGNYEMPPNQDMFLLDALAQAGGISSPVADKIYVIRRIPGKPEPLVINVSYRDAKRSQASNLRLTTGDVVSVEQTPATIVHDTLRSFLRFGFSSGLPLF